MDRPLHTFPLPPKQVRKLTAAGFHKARDLKDVQPLQLSEELDISRGEALEILQVVKPSNSSASQASQQMTALELLQMESQDHKIVTFCEALDDILGGGVSVRRLTEICGAPGIGKTQIGIQLAVDVQIPCVCGGLEGEAVYIDTEGSFIVERVKAVAEAAVSHLKNLSFSQSQDAPPGFEASLSSFTVENIMSKIYVYRCFDFVQLIALSHTLPDFLQEHPKVKLIVIDSIAFPFRHDMDDLFLRTRLLSALAQQMIKMACQNSLAVVLMNQMTTKFDFQGSGKSRLIPALGESWSHTCATRIVLFWMNGHRFANLYKSSSRKEATVPFQITAEGFRDVPTELEGNHDQN